MATNGARKAPPAAAASKAGLLDTGAVKEALSADKKKITLKIKKSVPKPSISGNWKESETLNTSNTAAAPAATSPAVNPLEEKTLAGFPNGRPLDDKVDTVQCKHCRRPVLRTSSATHIRECLNKKQEKLKKKKEAKEAKDAALRKEKGEDDEGIGARKSAIKGAAMDGEGAKKGKKRKIDDGAEKGPNAKKKKKDEPKAKGAKPKGPVDVERQCGVPLPNGGFCARSLTCKSHSMGLKRAVPGRSLPYDMLLAQYQKKNQAKQQRAAIDANAPLPEDLEPSGAVDSDEEKDSIMAALARHRPRPMATYTHVSQRSKYQYIRMKGMIRSALGTPPGGGNTNVFSGMGNGTDGMSTGRGLSLGLFGMGGMGGGGPMSASAEQFPQSAGFPLSAGLDGGAGSRRPSIMSGMGSAGGPRQILPGQLPGPGAQARKSSMASVGAT